jgi:hypothetical protein
MKRKLLICMLFAFGCMWLQAQDTICKKDGTNIVAKVTEVNPTDLIYTLSTKGKEKTASIPIIDIAYIVYANGIKEVYNKEKPTTEITWENSNEQAKALKTSKPLYNIFALNCFEMMFANLSVSYERILKSGRFSFKIPVSVGLGGRADFTGNKSDYSSDIGNTQFLQNRLYSGGLEFNYYPFKQTRNTFYLGVSGLAGRFVYTQSSFNTSCFGTGNYCTDKTQHIGTHYAGMIHFGGYLGISEHFLMGAKIGLGYKREETIENDHLIPKVQIDFNLAHRF